MSERLIDNQHVLADGRRVRLRLPHVGDRAAVHELLARVGADDLDEPRGLHAAAGARRWSVIAIVSDGETEHVAGVASVDPTDGAPTLVAEDAAVYDLLARALAERARPGGRAHPGERTHPGERADPAGRRVA